MSSEEVESLELKLKNLSQWEQNNNFTGDVFLIINGEETNYNGAHRSETDELGQVAFELNSTLANLFITSRRLKHGLNGLKYNFACGDCGEAGCNQILWTVEREREYVNIDMREASYKVKYDDFVSAIIRLFDKFIEILEEKDIEEVDFYFPFSKNVGTLEGVKELRNKLASIRRTGKRSDI
jgi:hypothetical protein